MVVFGFNRICFIFFAPKYPLATHVLCTTYELSCSQVSNHLFFPAHFPLCATQRALRPLRPPQIIFIRPLRRCSLSRGYYIAPQPGWSGLFSLYSWRRGWESLWWRGGWRGSVLLSWHPLPNNWMAYQVTPRSLIALFRPWLAETPTVTAHSKRGRERISKNSPPARLGSRLGIDCKVQGQNAAASFLPHPFFPRVEVIFTTFSNHYVLRHWLSRLIHASVHLLIQCYWVISGDGLSSRSSQTRHRFLITTNQKPDPSVCFCTVSPRGSARRYITLGSPSVALP